VLGIAIPLLYLSAGVQGIFEIIAAMQLRKEISDPWMLILGSTFRFS